MADTSGETDSNSAGIATESLSRVVELARQELRERGYAEEVIEMLLRRHRAPEQES